jgi:hypothetical protein
MMVGLEVCIDQMKLSMLRMARLTGERAADAGHVQLSRSRLRESGEVSLDRHRL